MCDRLRTESLVDDRGQLAHVCSQLCRISESWILQKIGTTDTHCESRYLVGGSDNYEPDVVGTLINIHRSVCGIFPVVLRRELGSCKRRLNRDAGGPNTRS